MRGVGKLINKKRGYENNDEKYITDRADFHQ